MNKKIFIFFLLVVLLFANCMFIFADDQTDDNTEDDNLSILDEVDDLGLTQVVVDITQLIKPTENNSDEEDKITQVEIIDPVLVDFETTQLRISPSDTSGFKAVLLSILGDYETTITDYTYQSGGSGYYSHSINIERDWTWICSCGVFALLLYCTFRTIGGICSRF